MIDIDRAEGSRPFASGLGVARPRSEPRPPSCRAVFPRSWDVWVAIAPFLSTLNQTASHLTVVVSGGFPAAPSFGGGFAREMRRHAGAASRAGRRRGGRRAEAVRGLRRKAILAALALNHGTVVSSDRLIDLVWGEAAPPTAPNTLQAYVSYLRGVLGSRAGIVARQPGYVLDPGDDGTDAATRPSSWSTAAPGIA